MQPSAARVVGPHLGGRHLLASHAALIWARVAWRGPAQRRCIIDGSGGAQNDPHSYFADFSAVVGAISLVLAVGMAIYGLMSKPMTMSIIGGGLVVGVVGLGLLANAVQLDRNDRSGRG